MGQGKMMTPHRGNTIIFQQVPFFILDTLGGFRADNAPFNSPHNLHCELLPKLQGPNQVCPQ